MSKKRKIKILRKPKRLLKVDPEMSAIHANEKAARQREKVIRNHPKYQLILSSMREGITSKDIAKHFAIRGWIEGSTGYFENCLSTFKLRNGKLIEKGSDNIDALDALIDGDKPPLDFSTELNRLLRLQKKRIAIDHKHEVDMQKLLDSVSKEVKLAVDIVQLLGQASGEIAGKNGTKSGDDTLPSDVSADVRSELRAIKLDEESRNKLYGLTNDFARKLKNVEKDKA